MLGSIVLLAAVSVAPVHMGVAIAPASVVAPGNVTSTSDYSIYNPGTVKESVTVQVITMRPVSNDPGHYAPDSEYGGHYTVSTPTFTLAPKGHKTVTVVVKPDGFGHHLGVVAEATGSDKSFARVRAEVVSKYTLTGPTAPNAPKPQSIAETHKSGTSPLVLILIPSLLAGILVACGRYLRLRRRARRTT